MSKSFETINFAFVELNNTSHPTWRPLSSRLKTTTISWEDFTQFLDWLRGSQVREGHHTLAKPAARSSAHRPRHIYTSWDWTFGWARDIFGIHQSMFPNIQPMVNPFHLFYSRPDRHQVIVGASNSLVSTKPGQEQANLYLN